MRYQECCELLLSMAVIITVNRVVVFGIYILAEDALCFAVQ